MNIKHRVSLKFKFDKETNLFLCLLVNQSSVGSHSTAYSLTMQNTILHFCVLSCIIFAISAEMKVGGSILPSMPQMIQRPMGHGPFAEGPSAGAGSGQISQIPPFSTGITFHLINSKHVPNFIKYWVLFWQFNQSLAIRI